MNRTDASIICLELNKIKRIMQTEGSEKATAYINMVIKNYEKKL